MSYAIWLSLSDWLSMIMVRSIHVAANDIISFFLRAEEYSTVWVKIAWLWSTLCDSMDCSPPGSSFHGILLARILQCVAIPFCRGSSWPKYWTQVSCTAGRLYHLSHQGSPFHCICIPNHFYPFSCQWTFRSFSCLWFCKQCCQEHWSVYIFFNYSFLHMYAQEWDFRIIWWLYFFEDLHTIFHSGYTSLHSLPTVYTTTPSTSFLVFVTCRLFNVGHSEQYEVVPHCSFILISLIISGASQVALVVKNSPASTGDLRDTGSISRSGRYLGGGQATPVFLPGESHRQRSLAVYSP